MSLSAARKMEKSVKSESKVSEVLSCELLCDGCELSSEGSVFRGGGEEGVMS